VLGCCLLDSIENILQYSSNPTSLWLELTAAQQFSLWPLLEERPAWKPALHRGKQRLGGLLEGRVPPRPHEGRPKCELLTAATGCLHGLQSSVKIVKIGRAMNMRLKAFCSICAALLVVSAAKADPMKHRACL
jgi:hypothetical protein